MRHNTLKSQSKQVSRRQLFLLLVRKSTLGRGTRVLTALAAVTLAATVAAALGNLQAGLKVRLEQQLAVFGANILITGNANGAGLPLPALQEAGRQLSLTVAPQIQSQPVVAASSSHTSPAAVQPIDPGAQQKLNGWWRVKGRWMTGPGEAMIGAALAQKLNVKPGSEVRFGLPGQGGSVSVWNHATIVGVITSDAEEDREILTPLAGDSRLFVQGAEVRAAGDAATVELTAETLRHDLPGANVHVLQRVAEADTLILARLGQVFGLLGLVIVLASGLCVSTTFGTMVRQRSREIGLQKALGATDTEILALFWGEALLLGAAGTITGYIIGSGFAVWIGQSVFQSPVGPQLAVVPLVIVTALGMTLLAAIPSARRIARLEPVVSLKGLGSDTA